MSPLQAAARFLKRRHPRAAERLGLGEETSDTQGLNDRAGVLIGRTALIDQAIVGGRGRLTIDGTSWPIEGPDLPEGIRVKITGAKEVVLVVDVG